ncbi:host cell division inhibitor Icd-like protein [Serratia proteamaculans]|uniref:host cell division inhibitor Icd-like protein n=1 Tax=Serratia proteamaculans TaxID=28151 RepID=UPI001C5952D9|nr:host cell division inhibitor Icd-like protein [Serratia proteamaculans]WEO89423.1 host cell division inhibitor Icd-like protein [Serratia proteamaculans]
MADIKSTQTRLEFTWRFFALARAELDGEIYRLSVDATTEQEARRVLAPYFILSLAARLPLQGVMKTITPSTIEEISTHSTVSKIGMEVRHA